MEWVEGRPLDRAWTASLRLRVACITSVARALVQLHRHNLIHGDVKFANILVDDNDRVKVVDFGLTRPRGAVADGMCFGGTPGWGAPEQFTPNAAVGPQADIWSLGVLLYHAMTGREPFRQTSADALIRAAAEDDPPLPESYAPKCPAELQRICLTALEKAPIRRYAGAHEFLADLQRYIRGEEVLARPTLLEKGFVGGLTRHLHEYAEWRRLGMLTDQEAARATRLARALIQSESEWILESRRVTLDRVGLYIGCWLLVMTVGIGFARAWGDLGRWAAPLGSLIVAVQLIAGSAAIYYKSRALAILLPLSGALSCTLLLWLLFREYGVLAPTQEAEWQQAAAILIGEPWGGLGNLQLAAISASGVVLGLGFRIVVSTAAYTLLCSLSAAILIAALAAEFGPVNYESQYALAQVAVWWLPAAVPAFCLGLWMDRRENRPNGSSLSRSLARDAAAILASAVLLFGLAMTLIASLTPTWHWFRAGSDETPLQEHQALALMINGVLFFSLATMLERQPGSAAHYLGRLLLWVSPPHLLGAIAWLEVIEGFGRRGSWIVLLAAVSVLFCFMSSLKQWKPFLFSGLAGLALAYERAFVYIGDESAMAAASDGAASLAPARLALALGAGVLGSVVISIAWKAPSWSISQKLRRWRRRRDSSRHAVTPDANIETE